MLLQRACMRALWHEEQLSAASDYVLGCRHGAMAHVPAGQLLADGAHDVRPKLLQHAQVLGGEGALPHGRVHGGRHLPAARVQAGGGLRGVAAGDPARHDSRVVTPPHRGQHALFVVDPHGGAPDGGMPCPERHRACGPPPPGRRPGLTTSGLLNSQARTTHVSRLSHKPFATLARLLAESGAISSRSAQRRSSMCSTGSPTACQDRHSSSSCQAGGQRGYKELYMLRCAPGSSHLGGAMWAAAA